MLKKYFVTKQKRSLITLSLLVIFLLSSTGSVFAQQSIKSLSDDIAQIAETVGPAVVNIDVVRYVETSPFGSQFNDPFFD